MTDDAMMRARLQQVLAYRQLQAAVRAGATHTIVNAVIWMALTFMIFQGVGPQPYLIAYFGLAVGELLVGFWKKLWPTLEAILVDGLVAAAFGLTILGRQAFAWQAGLMINPVSIFLGVWVLYSAFNSFRAYGRLREAFPSRPAADVIAWFDDLIYEIRHSDPTSDPLALDLPTRPHWKAKLLGTTAFFVSMNGGEVLVVGPWDFGLVPEDDGAGNRPRVELHIMHRAFKPFIIDDASWANYRRWLDEMSKHPDAG
jgi:hypothetical protein